MLATWIAAICAGLITWISTPWVRSLALRFHWLDRPGPRSSHQRIITRAGGLAVLLGLVCGLMLMADFTRWHLAFLVSALFISLLGWLDDVHHLNVRWRLIAQLGLAAAMVWWLGPIERIAWLGQSLNAPWLWTILAIPALVWMINLFNFMDGADGLASMQSGFSALCFAGLFHSAGQPWLAGIAACLAATCLGFLAWNTPPARIFLGDVGSLLLGWCLGLLALAGTLTGAVSVWLSFIVVSVFVVDATATLLKRVVRGDQWYTAHRDHAYQRLIRNHWSHRSVLLIFTALNLMLVLPVTVLAMTVPGLDFIGALSLGVVLLGLWAWVQRQAVEENRNNEAEPH
ncbi:MAG: glycosyl transferase [Pseudomonadota bacterium]